ncbi:MAG: hypothetical protein AAF988_06255 [Pseudomonadota bacterium]
MITKNKIKTGAISNRNTLILSLIAKKMKDRIKGIAKSKIKAKKSDLMSKNIKIPAMAAVISNQR